MRGRNVQWPIMPRQLTGVLPLDDALDFCVLLAEKADDRYERAAARLAARLALEQRLSLQEQADVRTLRDMLPLDPEAGR